MSPPKDKMRRGKLKRLIQAVRLYHPPPRRLLPSHQNLTRARALVAFAPLQADSAENVQAILLTAQTEQLLLKMNWKVRDFAKKKVLSRAAQFAVEVPAAFAGFDAPKASTPKYLLTPTMTTRAPSHPAAVAALANARYT